MPTAIDVEQEFNRALNEALAGHVPVSYNIADKFELGELTLDNVLRERRGCVNVYWGEGGEKQLGGCCTGPQNRSVIIDCYGSDRETAGRIKQFTEDAICAMEPSTYRRWAIRDSKLYPEQAQTYGERLILTVQHTS